MEFTSKDNSPILGIGEHLVTITQVMLAKAKASELYKDITEQLAVVFENAAGKSIKRWYNLKGYAIDPKQPEREDDQGRSIPNYAVGKDGNRIEDTDKTEAALRIIEQLGFHCGFAEGDKFKPADLEGNELGISVQRDELYSTNKVSYTLPATEVGKTASASVFAE